MGKQGGGGVQIIQIWQKQHIFPPSKQILNYMSHSPDIVSWTDFSLLSPLTTRSQELVSSGNRQLTNNGWCSPVKLKRFVGWGGEYNSAQHKRPSFLSCLLLHFPQLRHSFIQTTFKKRKTVQRRKMECPASQKQPTE